MRHARARYREGQNQWQVDEASSYTHPLDAQLYADRPILRLLGDIAEKDILDIGCGNGYLLRKLQAKAANVTGIDVSEEMVQEAQRLGHRNTPALLCVASADSLPFVSSIYDTAICSLTINNLSSADMTKRTFRDAARVLKPGGAFIISLPHPHTLATRSRFRWTDWEERQTQENLVPGEGFKRQIMGHGGSMISIVNYYWPKEVLINFATRAGFEVDRVVEETASGDEMARYFDELDPIYTEVPFFLVMCFVKRLV